MCYRLIEEDKLTIDINPPKKQNLSLFMKFKVDNNNKVTGFQDQLELVEIEVGKSIISIQNSQNNNKTKATYKCMRQTTEIVTPDDQTE